MTKKKNLNSYYLKTREIQENHKNQEASKAETETHGRGRTYTYLISHPEIRSKAYPERD